MGGGGGRALRYLQTDKQNLWPPWIRHWKVQCFDPFHLLVNGSMKALGTLKFFIKRMQEQGLYVFNKNCKNVMIF